MRSILLVAALVLSSGSALAQECVSCWNDTCTQLKSYGFPSCKPKAAPKAECPSGQSTSEDTNGHCCWPGQSWKSGACIGSPTKCPSGFQYKADRSACEAVPCPEGKERSDDGEHCCWKGQAWNKGRKTCVGVPACPAHFHVSAEACVANATVTFDIAPVGATLLIDGKKACPQLPCELELSAGKHDLRVEAQDHKPQNRRIEVGSESTTESFKLERLPVVRFESEPKGAAVSVDGKQLCPATPCTVLVEPGPHEVKMTMAQHDSAIERRTLAPGDTVKLSLASIVQLKLDSKPRGALVAIDKTVVCPTTPCAVDVREGKHDIFMVLPDGMRGELSTVAVEANHPLVFALRAVDPGAKDEANVALLRRILAQPEVDPKAKEAHLTELALARGSEVALDVSSLAVGSFLNPLRRRLRCDGGRTSEGPTCEQVADELATNAPGAAAKYYGKACDADQPRSCFVLGQWVLSGTNVTRDPARAAKLLDRACTLGKAEACQQLARGWATTTFGKTDEAAASQYLRSSCTLGVGEACTTLAARIEATGHGEAQARELYDAACRANDQRGCAASRRLADAERARDQEAAQRQADAVRAEQLARGLFTMAASYYSLSTSIEAGESRSMSGFGFELGMQLGVGLGPHLSLVFLGKASVLSGDGGYLFPLTVGGGVRFEELGPLAILAGAGYSLMPSFSSNGVNENPTPMGLTLLGGVALRLGGDDSTTKLHVMVASHMMSGTVLSGTELSFGLLTASAGVGFAF